jgi:tRNA(Ile)-lysidine synthase
MHGEHEHRNFLSMNRTLHKRVVETIERHSMIRPGNRVGVGVSGGADSVALLRVLAELQPQLGIELLVLHFHHQLRGPEADEDERFVGELARTLDLEFVSDRADVAGEARRNNWNLEDAARRLRYQFFACIAASRDLDRVAVAHTAEDQAETVLAHILRGTGLAGLAGIYPVAGLTIRPLLDIGRDQLRDYLFSINQPWREDATNQDTSRTRARIRHQLIPLLRRDFDPLCVTRLARLADLAREEEVFWRSLEDERFAALVSREPSGGVSLGIPDLLSPFRLPASKCSDPESSTAPALALTRRLIRRIVLELRGTRQQLTARHVEDVLHLATKSQSGSRVELPGILVQRVFNRLVFSPAFSPEEPGSFGGKQAINSAIPEFEYAVSLPGTSESRCIVIPEIGRRFSLKVVDWPSAARETVLGRGALDLDRIRLPLVLRNWRPGDAYRPQGRQRGRKLKRLLLASRIPLNKRASWPVLTSDGDLVWAPGCPVADEFAPRLGTQAGLLIAEEEL